jgi:hypothetical protein
MADASRACSFRATDRGISENRRRKSEKKISVCVCPYSILGRIYHFLSSFINIIYHFDAGINDK